jgi:hypothetical protein
VFVAWNLVMPGQIHGTDAILDEAPGSELTMNRVN